MDSCYAEANSILEFAAMLIFQGFNLSYIPLAGWHLSLDGNVMQAIADGSADALYSYMSMISSCINGCLLSTYLLNSSLDKKNNSFTSSSFIASIGSPSVYHSPAEVVHFSLAARWPKVTF